MKIVIENRSSKIYYNIFTRLSPLPHLHKQIEIIFSKKNCFYAYVDSKKYYVPEGQLFISFPNQIHYYNTENKGEYYILIFSPDDIYDLSSLLYKYIPKNNVIDIQANNEINNILKKTFKTNGTYKTTEINGYINILMSKIIGMIELQPIDSQYSLSIRNIIKYCNDNFKDNITLDDVAYNVNLSKYYVSHTINHYLNMNFNEFINNLRVKEACNLLKNTDISITEISENIGFGTIRSFNRAFSKNKNITPAQYRKRTNAEQLNEINLK